MLGKRILILYINKHDFIRVWKNVKGFVRASSFWLKKFFETNQAYNVSLNCLIILTLTVVE